MTPCNGDGGRLRMSRESDFEARIRERARRDPAFRARLLEDPSATLAEESAVPGGPEVRVRVVEEHPGEVVVVLPAGIVDSSEVPPDER
jgi:hypothetical protein